MLHMKKELTITVEIDKFEVVTSAELSDWNNASEKERDIFISNEVKNYLNDNIDDIIYDLIKKNKIHI